MTKFLIRMYTESGLFLRAFVVEAESLSDAIHNECRQGFLYKIESA